MGGGFWEDPVILDLRFSACPVSSTQTPIYISATISPERPDPLQVSSGRYLGLITPEGCRGGEGVPRSVQPLCAAEGGTEESSQPAAHCPGFSEF